MKASVRQIETGLLNYIDDEIVNKLDGLKKWAAMSAVAIMTAKGETLASKLLNHSIVKSLDLVDEQGMVDIDTLKQALIQSAEKTGKVTQEIPMIGTVAFDRSDVEKLYSTIISMRG